MSLESALPPQVASGGEPRELGHVDEHVDMPDYHSEPESEAETVEPEPPPPQGDIRH